MKKILLFTILFLSLSFYSNAANDEFTYDKSKETLYWKFLKERLFDGKTPVVSSFQNDIVIRLFNATSADSSVVENLIKELRLIIPDRDVRLTDKNFEVDDNNEMIHDIVIGFGEEGEITSNRYIPRSKNINGNQIFHNGFKGISQDDIFRQSINIRLNDSISYAERKQYIEYAIIKSMCTVKGDSEWANTFIEGAILNYFDYDPTNTEFSEVDKFVINKLYSDDFQKQFKKFMVANSSVRYYYVFTHNEMMRTIAYFVCLILTLFIFLLTYKPIIKRNFKWKYFNYLLPGLLVLYSAKFIFLVFRILAENAVIFTRGDFITIMLLTISAFFFSAIIYFIERALIKKNTKFAKELLIKILIIPIVIILPLSIAITFMPDYYGMANVVLWVVGLTFALARGTILYFKNIGELELREKEAELSVLREANSRAELQSLHARINPHFLYNSLNSIAGLVKTNPEKTEKMALSLSDMFRYLINRKNEVLTDVESEVEMVQSYLEIEQIRFGDRLSFSIEVDEELKTKQIPKFILQPMVENAIKHGISKIEGNGEIKISVAQTEDWLEIKVADNGPDFPEGLVAGYGLQSLYDLLKICYKDKAEVNWQNSPDKMIVVRIPLTEETN